MLHLSVPGVSSGKRVVAKIGPKVRRRKSSVSVVELEASGVPPVVDGGGIVSNRWRGGELLLCCSSVAQ